jgi:hypothetical protein
MSAQRGTRSSRVYLSWVLLALSAVLFAVFALLWYQDRQESGEIPPPPSRPGQAEAINVKQALEAEGLTVAFEPGGGRSPDLSVAGQLLTVDGQALYAFIYPQGVSAREDESIDIVPEEFEVRGTNGEPIAGGPPRVYIGSNVIVALYTDSGEVASKVQAAIEGLP